MSYPQNEQFRENMHEAKEEAKSKVAGKMKKGHSYKKEIDNKKPRAKKDSERFEENGGMSGNGKTRNGNKPYSPLKGFNNYE